jgi:hypothetical protein
VVKDLCSDGFFWVPHQVMESLAADHKSSLDLVELSISHLIKHCEVNEEQLVCVHPSLLAAGIKSKLMAYEKNWFNYRQLWLDTSISKSISQQIQQS